MDTVIYALSAALAWGSGDFAGGVAARRSSPLTTVFFSYCVGLLCLAVAALVLREKFPVWLDLMWGALAGLSGMVGLGFLFRGFVGGRMGIVAPVSAVLATVIPVLFTAFTRGLPGGTQMVGFVAALASIWLLSRPEPLGGRPAGLDLAILAGLGFGGFFTILGQISDDAVLWPLVAGRLASVLAMAGLALFGRRALLLAQPPWGLLALAGVLDVGGNLFFLLAVHSGRLDVAAVLASLYPAITALLARLFTREYIARVQAIGVGIAVLAIALITV